MSLSVLLFLLCLTALVLAVVDLASQRPTSPVQAAVFLLALTLTLATARGLGLF